METLNFKNQLLNIDLKPKEYLKMARFIAKNRGYDPKLLKFSNDDKHKLTYKNVDFGRVGYNDKIIYYWLETNNIVEKGTMKKKYINYRKRAYDTMIKTNNKISPASLSYYILW